MKMATLEPERISLKAYAERRGCTRHTVRAAIKSGRIADAARQVGTRWEIDAELADQLWAANTDPTWRGNVPPPGADAESSREQTARAALGLEPRDDEDFAAARTRHERAKADLAEIRREEEAGRLVDAAQQRREGFQVAQLVRDALLQMADRLAPDLCAEMDQAKVHGMLRREVIDCLRHLCEHEGGVEIQRGSDR